MYSETHRRELWKVILKKKNVLVGWFHRLLKYDKVDLNIKSTEGTCPRCDTHFGCDERAH